MPRTPRAPSSTPASTSSPSGRSWRYPVENRPGAGAALLRRVTDAGVSLDLMYTTLDGRLVLGSEDLAGLRAAIG